MTSKPSPFAARADGVTAALRLLPKGGANRIEGLTQDGAGRWRLRARVSAAPEKGKANAALLKLLAKSWGLAKRDLELVGGAAARDKTVLAHGAPGPLLHRLDGWLKEHCSTKISIDNANDDKDRSGR